MGKKLIITEKPSVAFDFARVLKVPNGGNRRDGFIENNEYVISWCYGHLVQMVYPEEYDMKYKKWNLEDLPFLPKDYKYGVVESAKDQYFVVNKLLHREDIDTVYWAGDSGKEGQTIEENIRMYGGVRNGMNELRVWIDSQTDDEMLRGINEAKPMSDYANLGKSGIMRTIEDYALGINFSRALSVKYGRLINDAAATSNYTAIALGRVMTCVLGMVVDREREIRNFNETPFFKVSGNFSDVQFSAEWKAVEGSKYYESPLLYGENANGFKAKESAEELISLLNGKEAFISNKDISTSKKRAPLLFNLAELQSECSKRFKISPAQTLEIIQDLYEKKYTTYPRTDARVLTTAVAKEISKNLYKLQGYGPTEKYVKEILSSKKYIGLEKTGYVDDSKVTDHYAVIPTGQCNGIEALPPLEKSVYDLIVRRFLSIFYPAAEYKNAKLTVNVDSEMLFAGAKVLTSPGYLEIAGIPSQKNSDEANDESEEDEGFSKEKFISFVESLSIGDSVDVNGYKIKEGKTNPPKRYTSGNLILAMENAGKLIEDEELREQIKTTGIGTSATRGEIIDKLIRIGYLNLNGKTQIISPENLGEMIYEVVVLTAPSLLSPEMTASWEKGLEGITNGTVNDLDYRNKLEDYIRSETTKMIQSDLQQQIAANINQFTGKGSKGIATRKPLGLKCPSCGGELSTTAFGYGCSNYFDENIKCKFAVGQIAGLDIPEEQFRKLITEGKTDLLDGFKSKSKKNFKSILRLEKNEDNEFSVAFDFSENPTEYVDGLFCPVCGGKIAETGYGFSCENRFQEENQCYFSIGEVAGKKIALDDFTKLINDGVTPVISGFKSKSGQKFNAKLRIKTNEEGKKVIAFDFDGIEPEKLEGVKCPDCGGEILVKSFGFGCSNYKADDANSCRFIIGNNIASKNISATVAKELLLNNKTSTLRGFKGKSGKKFDACLILQKNEDTGKHEVVFDFDNVEAKPVNGVACPVCGGKVVKTLFGFGCDNYKKDDPESCKFSIGEIAGVKPKESMVKELLTNGITSPISGFKSKSGKAFEAKLALAKNEAGVVTGVKFVFEDEDKILEDVLCPICQGKVIKGHFGYRCENNNRSDDGCKFFIGKIAGLMLSQEQFTELITNGKTNEEIQGFTSKAGNLFSARLKLDENFRASFDFDNNNNNSQSSGTFVEELIRNGEEKEINNGTSEN